MKCTLETVGTRCKPVVNAALFLFLSRFSLFGVFHRFSMGISVFNVYFTGAPLHLMLSAICFVVVKSGYVSAFIILRREKRGSPLIRNSGKHKRTKEPRSGRRQEQERQGIEQYKKIMPPLSKGSKEGFLSMK